MSRSLQLARWFLALGLGLAGGRTWIDIPQLLDVSPPDVNKIIFLINSDPMDALLASGGAPFTSAPTIAPSELPSTSPSQRPTKTPSSTPTLRPTTKPSLTPTSVPTATPDPYPPNPEPLNPPRDYFNYNTSAGSRYGPGYEGLIVDSSSVHVGIEDNNWGKWQYPLNNYYWAEFTNQGFGPWKGLLTNSTPFINHCETGLQQSPIDLRPNSPALETHMIRHHPGDLRVTGDRVQKQIESNKLRLLYPRRPCADKTNIACQDPSPPCADFPHHWPDCVDLMHIDIKVPSEHTVKGQRFDAEMQMFFLNPGRARMGTLSVLISASDAGYNYYFQEALDAFQDQYDQNRAQCGLPVQHQRQLNSQAGDGSGSDDNGKERGLRELQSWGVWNPFDPIMVPSLYFYRYDGSLTEPPCGEWVTWFVCDTPMNISTAQLDQLKTILFTNYGPDCNKTSVHFEHSVARPIRLLNGRNVTHSSPANYVADPTV